MRRRTLPQLEKQIAVLQRKADALKKKEAKGVNQRYGRNTVALAGVGSANRSRRWVMKQSLRTPDYTTRCSDLPVARA